MRMSEGVEWAAHALVVLASLGEGRRLSAAALAEFHALPSAYMAKHLQALARAGLVCTARGAGGGYSLARSAREITLLDVVEALEGAGPGFRCADIRFRGPCASRRRDSRPCGVATRYWNAEAAYRAALRTETIGDLAAEVAAGKSADEIAAFAAWLGQAR